MRVRSGVRFIKFYRISLYVLIVLNFSSDVQVLYAQEDQHILDYSERLLLRLYTVTNSNSLAIENEQLGRSLNLLPNGTTNLGLGFNYKRLGLGLSFSLPRSAERDRKFGKTTRFDLQGSLYGRKFGADGYFQLYKGYYNSNPNDFIEWTNDAFPQLPSMKVLSVGVIGFYIFNSDNYSYRASFVRDEIQTKSSGSFLLGGFVNFDQSVTDNGFVPSQFPDSVRSVIDIREFTNLAIGISVGYAHNFVVRDKFIVGIALLPGIGYQEVGVVQLNGVKSIEQQPAAQLLTRAAIGYEFKHFFFGVTGSVNFRSIDFGPYDFRLATEQVRIIIGKRFNVSKKNDP